MRPQGSLRTRLVLLTLLAVVFVWMISAVLIWREARHELAELMAHPPTTEESHLTEEREELANEIALQVLKPLLLALPLLALLLIVGINFALKPLQQLAKEVSERAPERLDSLNIDRMTREVAPLVTRLNTLFADITRRQDNERRFTANAAHELRTPLAALKAQAQVALASLNDAERRHALEQIILGCDRATHLVTQLLTLARLDAGSATHFQKIELAPIAEDILAANAGAAIERHCELTFNEGKACVVGDAVLLHVLLRNLIDNALLHSGAHRIAVCISQTAMNVILSVEDDGQGIPAEDRERVLQRFHRITSTNSLAGAANTANASTASSGSGLGLSIVAAIARLHNAQLRIEAPDQVRGTVLTLLFPVPATADQ